MPFGLTNALVTFQSYIDDCLLASIDDFAVCNLDEILINSTDEKEHDQHVRKVLERLWEFSLYCKAENCQFRVSEVGFLGIVINSEGVSMESDRIATIENWPTPNSVRDIQLILGFTNFYRRFIRKYAKVTLPLTKLLRKTEKARAPSASEGPLRPAPKWE